LELDDDAVVDGGEAWISAEHDVVVSEPEEQSSVAPPMAAR
jgi:hypothetical protein